MAGSETGLQLFARLKPRPSLLALDVTLFPDGPGPQELVEVAGEPSTGKTLLFCRLIARCVLPKALGGAQARAVLLDADCHFRIELVAKMIRAEAASSDDPEAVVRESLDRVGIYPVRDGFHLRVTLHAVRAFASTQPDLALVLLDSVSAFYWQDAMSGGIRKMNLYAKDLLRYCQKTLCDFKGVIMYTRPSYFRSEGGVEPCAQEPGRPTRRVTLAPFARPGLFTADVEALTTSKRQLFFTIDSSGIHWQADAGTAVPFEPESDLFIEPLFQNVGAN